MKILPISKDNIDDVLKVDESFSDGWNKDMLSSGIDNGLKLFGLFDGELKGYIAYTVYPDYADIETVLIKKEERRKGYGVSLMEFALSDIEKSGIKKVFLEVRKSNAPAISFYKKAGFCFLNERKKYYPDGEDAAVYLRSKD